MDVAVLLSLKSLVKFKNFQEYFILEKKVVCLL